MVTDPGGTTWVGWGPLTRFAVNLTIKKLTTPHLAARCSVWSHDQPRVVTCVCAQPKNTRTAHAAATWMFNIWRRGQKHTALAGVASMPLRNGRAHPAVCFWVGVTDASLQQQLDTHTSDVPLKHGLRKRRGC